MENPCNLITVPEIRDNFIKYLLGHSSWDSVCADSIAGDNLGVAVFLFITLVIILNIVGSIGLYRLQGTQREKFKQATMIRRYMALPPGDARDELILDLCVDIHDWYHKCSWYHKNLAPWRAFGDKLLHDIPGAEVRWEDKHPGKYKGKWLEEKWRFDINPRPLRRSFGHYFDGSERWDEEKGPIRLEAGVGSKSRCRSRFPVVERC